MKANIGISEKDSAKIADFLSKLLADEFVLYVKIRNAHWNLEGSDFHSKHVYFEELYTEIQVIIDEVAERIRKIGHFAPASLTDYLKLTHLTEKRNDKNDSLSYIADLLEDYDSIILFIREQFDTLEGVMDKGTDDYITGLLEQHEKTSWMLRSHLN
jgi:starvation-inducible DNA-binding protein